MTDNTHIEYAFAAPTTQAAPMESVLIDGVAYQTPAPVAAELLRLHIDARQAASQQEAREPVASEEERRKLKGLMLEVWACAKPQPDVTNAQLRALLSRCLPHIRTLALAEAPKPAPAPLSEDAKDAARYRWLRDFHHGDVQDELPYIAAGEGYDGAWALTGEDADKEIDAAIAAQGGK